MAKEDTTSTGVSDEIDNDAIDQDELNNIDAENEQTLNPRDEMMSDIVAKARAAREAEETGDLGATTDDDLGENDDDPNDGEDDMATVKVDGETFQVSKKEVDEAGGISAYQKEKAASNRLREAAAERQQVTAERARLQQEREEFERTKVTNQSSSTANNENQPSDDSDADDVDSKELAAQLYSGDEDLAAQAIEKLLKGRGKPATPGNTNSITNEQLVSQATAQAEWNIEKKQANEEFAKEYGDINEKPMLRQAANEETKRLAREHPDWGPRKIIMQAGENVREEFKNEFAKQLNTDDGEMDKRRDRKKAMDNVSGATGKKSSAPVPKAKTQKEIVAGMQKQRSHSNI